MRRHVTRLGVAVVTIAALTGCTVASATPTSSAAAATAATSRASAGLVVANGHGWTAAGLGGPDPGV